MDAWLAGRQFSGLTVFQQSPIIIFHVWGILKDIAGEKDARLVAIAESDSALVNRARSGVPASVKFFDDFVKMLDEIKPDAVIATTSNDRHLEILRECARRHIHFSTEKPMATNAADAREMARLAQATGIKLMVNYWNAWVPPTPSLVKHVRDGDVGPVRKIIVEYGHAGPKEIGVSEQFAAWLYDPLKNGGGAIMKAVVLSAAAADRLAASLDSRDCLRILPVRMT